MLASTVRRSFAVLATRFVIGANTSPARAQARQPAAVPRKKARPAAHKAKMTDAQKITNAMSAAPAEIAKHVTIMDWPETEDGQPRQLRAGTNGWVCYRNSPGEFGGASIDDRMCLDKHCPNFSPDAEGRCGSLTFLSGP